MCVFFITLIFVFLTHKFGIVLNKVTNKHEEAELKVKDK